MASSLTRQDLLDLEAFQLRMVQALQTFVTDRSITAANRQQARDLLASAEHQLGRIRATLDEPEPASRGTRTSIGDINERMGWGPGW